ncbi:uncharacterized protein MONBRDRAFT_37517 [Monosiga brevicollis MX1]|uniref:Tryptophan synthase beta chain-like PALP domain-containing protein n=1 Tax=Monosiga brevicollis TaxID=81824 RepID=A9V280_MONBE|nr:uncharacterized protein MONBRDRAFT_37517 [Monosiga brevicollis MX1]EDQ88209.1 predicted protein [Monosiga brevicollis MX1]|eukprot:XP_001746802.1 hypothetical protein [Monosiga brevicollis MX1]
MAAMCAPTFEDVQAAQTRIAGKAHVTPVLTSQQMDRRAGLQLHFKCETFQKGGSFKIRGALNAISKLPDDVRDVVTHSSGNHAQAVALACQLTGRNAHIVMPDNAPAVKRAAVVDYGARVITCESTQPAREAAAEATRAALPKSALIPPYDHCDVIAGQGTMALELLEQVPGLDALIVPIGGGGMLAGICLAAKGIRPDIKVIAAEPARADDCYQSIRDQQHVLLKTYPDTVADGLRTSMGNLNWPIIRDHVDKVFTVSEHDIIQGQRLVMERMKVVIEPSAGVPVAVAMSDEFRAFAESHKLRSMMRLLSGVLLVVAAVAATDGNKPRIWNDGDGNIHINSSQTGSTNSRVFINGVDVVQELIELQQMYEQYASTLLPRVDYTGNLGCTDAMVATNVTHLVGNIELANCGGLQDLQGLQSLVSVSGNVRIHSLGALENVDALGSLTVVGGYVSIKRCRNLPSTLRAVVIALRKHTSCAGDVAYCGVI